MEKKLKEDTCKDFGRSVIFSVFYADFCPKLVIITTFKYMNLQGKQITSKNEYICVINYLNNKLTKKKTKKKNKKKLQIVA